MRTDTAGIHSARSCLTLYREVGQLAWGWEATWFVEPEPVRWMELRNQSPLSKERTGIQRLTQGYPAHLSKARVKTLFFPFSVCHRVLSPHLIITV